MTFRKFYMTFSNNNIFIDLLLEFAMKLHSDLSFLLFHIVIHKLYKIKSRNQIFLSLTFDGINK